MFIGRFENEIINFGPVLKVNTEYETYAIKLNNFITQNEMSRQTNVRKINMIIDVFGKNPIFLDENFKCFLILPLILITKTDSLTSQFLFLNFFRNTFSKNLLVNFFYGNKF